MIRLDIVEAEIRKVYQYAKPNLSLIGWMGFIGFPVYYFIWKFLFPQPYENLALRMTASILFFGILFRDKLTPNWRKYFHLYYLFIITLCLPFFFFYMLLMNDWSMIWIVSYMSAIFVHILLVHITWVMFAQTLVGIGLAMLCAWVSQGFYLSLSMNWSYVPVFLFISLFGNLLYIRNQSEHETNISVAKAFGAGIAHEMRNPLSALYSSMDIIQSIIPNLNEKKDCYSLSAKEVNLLHEVIINAMESISSGNETIDLLLTSIDENRVSRSTFKSHNVDGVVTDAVNSFSYKNSVDKFAIFIDVRETFEYFGSNTLLKYLLYNLFKNAYRYRASNEFHIDVVVGSEKECNYIQVKDNGPGIALEIIENIFQDFYTTGKSENYGLGLPFCKKVMTSFGGSIECQSEPGKGSLFIMNFPKIRSKAVQKVKRELITLKSVLLVSSQPVLISRIHDLNYKMGFSLEILNVHATLKKQEHEFEYDLIIIDLDSIDTKINQLDCLESLLTFTEARIVYLFHNHPIQRQRKMGFNPLWIEIQTWLLNTISTLENIFFGDWHSLVNVTFESITEQCKRKVMVVDDSKSLRKLTSIILEKNGFEVIQCENGVQVLEVLDSMSVDLIIMDIEMPIMNGIDVSEKIRQSTHHYANVPIIAHTGDSSPTALERIKSAGISDYIIKPADKNKLIEKIINWI